MDGSLADIDAILTAQTDPLAALAALRAVVRLDSMLAALRGDSCRMADVTARSYRHDNGFDKIVLAAPVTSPLKLVLHVWHPKTGPATDNIHNHRWNFASVVLCGALRLDLYQHDEDGSSHSIMHYSSPAGNEFYQLEPVGDMTVSVHASVTMAGGSTYTWAADLLHRAWGVGEQVTATLIVQGQPTRPTTTVLLRRPQGESPITGAQRITSLAEADIRQTLAMLVQEGTGAAWSPRPGAA